MGKVLPYAMITGLFLFVAHGLYAQPVTLGSHAGDYYSPGTSFSGGVLDTDLDFNGAADLICDADGNTKLVFSDDTIDIEIGGASDFIFTANTFTAQASSSIWTDTIGSTSGTTITLGVGTERALFTDGAEATPPIAFTSDPDTGIRPGTAADTIGLVCGATERAILSASGLVFDQNVNINCTSSACGALMMEAPSSTNPTLLPLGSASTTGFGAQASGNISAIVTGTEKARFTTTGLQMISGSVAGQYSVLTTLAAAATTFAITGNVHVVDCDGGGNTIATITGGVTGQLLTLIYVDGNCTITDTDAHTANTIDTSAARTSADDAVHQLVFDGTSWYEIAFNAN